MRTYVIRLKWPFNHSSRLIWSVSLCHVKWVMCCVYNTEQKWDHIYSLKIWLLSLPLQFICDDGAAGGHAVVYAALEIPLSASSCSDISGTRINTCTPFWNSLFIKHWSRKVSGCHSHLLPTTTKQAAALTLQFLDILRSAISLLSSAADCCWVITMWPSPPPAPVWTWISGCSTRLADDLWGFWCFFVFFFTQKRQSAFCCTRETPQHNNDYQHTNVTVSKPPPPERCCSTCTQWRRLSLAAQRCTQRQHCTCKDRLSVTALPGCTSQSEPKASVPQRYQSSPSLGHMHVFVAQQVPT